jgi:hypothetical protein
MSGLLLQLPVFPVMGNHDEGSEYYESYFRTYRDSGRNYSFDWGRVHFVVLLPYVNWYVSWPWFPGGELLSTVPSECVVYS